VWIYTAVSGVWAALGLQAQLRGLVVTNCGCFGVYLSQHLSWLVLAQDALLLVYAALMIRAARRGAGRRRRRGRPPVAGHDLGYPTTGERS
jgi:hypothetical protein